MSIKPRKIVAAALVLVLALSLLAACSGGTADTTPETAANTETAASAEPGASTAPESNPDTDGDPSGTHTVVDSFGHEVEVPNTIERIILPSSFPVFLSFVSVFGMQDQVVNGLPASFSREVYWADMIIAPQVDAAPTVADSSSGGMSAELCMELDPDVIFVSDEDTYTALSEKGLTVIGIELTDYEAFRNIYTIMGEVFNMQDRASEYLAYLDEMLAFISERIEGVEKTDVLYFDYARMLRPNTVAEWWISAAGGASVTADQADVSQVIMDVEALYAADPDVIIDMLHSNMDAIYSDPEWASLTAVQNGHVYNTPVGCHLMGNWTSEQPIMILWTASKLYPEQFADVDLVEYFGDFYSTWFGVDFTEQQINDIINGFAA